MDKQLLLNAAERANTYLEALNDRKVAPSAKALKDLETLRIRMPEVGIPSAQVLEELDHYGSPATMASAGGRYFGLVIGGALPATVAAQFMAAAWDQNAGMRHASPLGAAIEEIALGWMVDILGFPSSTDGGLVSGATMAKLCGLAAARNELLSRAGWDVEARGLFGAPELEVVVGAEVHVSLLKALAMLGLGRERVLRVEADEQGRMLTSKLPPLGPLSILCLQAGNVNTGAFDPAPELCALARQAQAWTHVDGAFGLWARATPNKRDLATGFEQADSWSLDAHKWLNVPYDCGAVLCREPKHLHNAMTAMAPYLLSDTPREPSHSTPEMSRRARGVEVWAALRNLGRRGVAELIESSCAHAKRFACGLEEAGYKVLNDVHLNQVLVSFGSDERTQRTIDNTVSEGVCWCGGTVWRGRKAMRISVSSWATTERDVELSLASILRSAERAIEPEPNGSPAE